MSRSLAPTLTFKERIESLKAGLFGAVALALGFLLISGLNYLINQGVDAFALPVFDSAYLLQSISWTDPDWWLSGAIACLSGFLFGVTYRYIIRTDENSHLKTGAVGAFGLVKGLTQVDMGIALGVNFWLLLILLGESMMLFAIAQVVLDISLDAGAFQPLRQASPQSEHDNSITW